MRRMLIGAILFLTAVAANAGAEESPFLLMASTIGPIDAGIVGALEDAFKEQTGLTATSGLARERPSTSQGRGASIWCSFMPNHWKRSLWPRGSVRSAST